MSLPLPTSLSPSKVTSFKDCALAFRLSAIDRLPEVKSLPAAKGTVVHRALQLLFSEEPAGARGLDVALAKLARAVPEVLGGAEYAELPLDDEERESFVDDARRLLTNYYELEDPDLVRVIGTELRLSVDLGTLRLSGIIDRLELDDDGSLVVTDYKTGRAPSESYQQSKLVGIHFYALLCEQLLGQRPVRIQLLHLREPMTISTAPSDQSIRGMRQQTLAIWSAVERACRTEDFRPKPGFACGYCSFQAYCPAVGGDLSQLPPPRVAGHAGAVPLAEPVPVAGPAPLGAATTAALPATTSAPPPLPAPAPTTSAPPPLPAPAAPLPPTPAASRPRSLPAPATSALPLLPTPATTLPPAPACS